MCSRVLTPNWSVIGCGAPAPGGELREYRAPPSVQRTPGTDTHSRRDRTHDAREATKREVSYKTNCGSVVSSKTSSLEKCLRPRSKHGPSVAFFSTSSTLSTILHCKGATFSRPGPWAHWQILITRLLPCSCLDLTRLIRTRTESRTHTQPPGTSVVRSGGQELAHNYCSDY